ncbi:metal ABC transporter permease [Anaerococcus hydrogenalis]|uniref:metal ABC transporter permease n=1 Tax=Anaerococcus hydrogenalis TaxID=33029 RepID=UPI001D4A725B|nr:metal ABC transporter permease [Anaerococcus hydrogenalis]MBS5989214.1 metal ABC transporter permease [Anaerococcus hydrogenalis]
MFNIFEYDFMQRAFIAGALIAVILPCIGQLVLIKRLSMIGDTLSHSSLAGLSIGLCFGISPILSAMLFCVFAAFSIEIIRNKLKNYQEVSTVIILAASIGIAGIMADLSTSANAICSYLFGSIVTISDQEFYLLIALSLCFLVIYFTYYNDFYLLLFDPTSAQILGLRVKFLNFTISFLTAIAVAISAKTIGSLIVSSLLVIPSIMAIEICKSYKKSLILSIIFSLIFVFLGLFLSYIFNLRPGSVIVLIAVLSLILVLLIKK